MKGNVRVGNLLGIPFYVNHSWFLVLGLMTLIYGEQLARFPELPGFTCWLLGLIVSLLSFFSVVAHELGHSFITIAQGIKVKSITLFLFGGLASLEKEFETPLQTFWVAIAGPLVSLSLFGILTIIRVNLAFLDYLTAIATLLALLNLVLALFNLIPCLPLDGGAILKAAIWQITSNPNKGIFFAGRVSQFFGWLVVITGGLDIVGISSVGGFEISWVEGFYTILIGWLLIRNAGFSVQSAIVSRFTAQEAVIPNSPIVSFKLTLRAFTNNYIIGKNKWEKFLAINEAGQLLGAILVDDIKKVPTSKWNKVYVYKLIQPLEDCDTVKATQSLLEVVKRLEKQESLQLAVVRDDGTAVGLISRVSIIQFMQQHTSKFSVKRVFKKLHA
ncbi:MAG: site-2 protease family protein [Cyanobacteria bacterium P01_F01_bin.143]